MLAVVAGVLSVGLTSVTADQQWRDLIMRILPNMALAVLLLGSTGAVSAFAANDTAGCPPGMHRAEAEGGGVGSRNLDTRKAEAEGGGVGSRNLDTRKAAAETGSQRLASSSIPCTK